MNILRVVNVVFSSLYCDYVFLIFLTSNLNYFIVRLYDLTSDLKRPEQEYYLQAIESGRYGNIASNCSVAFSFGGEHLWDRFTVSVIHSPYTGSLIIFYNRIFLQFQVFILFSDGSIYILCPVVPFGRYSINFLSVRSSSNMLLFSSFSVNVIHLI